MFLNFEMFPRSFGKFEFSLALFKLFDFSQTLIFFQFPYIFLLTVGMSPRVPGDQQQPSTRHRVFSGHCTIEAHAYPHIQAH